MRTTRSLPPLATLAALALIAAATPPTAVASEPGPVEEVEVHFVHKPPPVYPQEALEEKLEGTVVARLFIDPSGTVREAAIVEGPELLREATLEAVRQWRSEPLGAEIDYRVTINYRLDRDEEEKEEAEEAGDTSR